MRAGLPPRVVSLVGGLFLFALAIVLLLESRLGLSPWDVLNQGIARHSPLSFGAANVAVGLAVLALAWALGAPPGVGTVANAVLVGTFIQLLTSIDGISRLASDPLDVRIGLLAAGIALVGPASAFYIGADLGAGPRDTLMLVGALRTHRRVGVVRAALEVTALAAGIVLGGTFGVGTVAFALLVGPVVQTSFALLARSPLAQSAPVPVVHGVHEDDREPGDGRDPALCAVAAPVAPMPMPSDAMPRSAAAQSGPPPRR